MVARAPETAPPATLEDLFAIPEEQRRHELIDGDIVEKGAASGEHGSVQHKVAIFTGPFDRRPGGRWPGGWWFATEVEIYFEPVNTLRPDVTGWRCERALERPRGTLIRVRPDWGCEILSTNRRNDLVKKKRVYLRHQTPIVGSSILPRKPWRSTAGLRTVTWRSSLLSAASVFRPSHSR